MMPAQCSFPVAAVIGSAVVPTLIANSFFDPRRPRPARAAAGEAAAPPPLGHEEV
jgi:glutathione-regulated potassium-efflux system ancillary protein KefC